MIVPLECDHYLFCSVPQVPGGGLPVRTGGRLRRQGGLPGPLHPQGETMRRVPSYIQNTHFAMLHSAQIFMNEYGERVNRLRERQ